MKTDLSLQQFVQAFSRFTHRYHVVIFTIFVLGGLSVATYMLYNATTTTSSSTGNATMNFDQDTIDRIKQLRSAEEKVAPLTLPSGRTNPF